MTQCRGVGGRQRQILPGAPCHSQSLRLKACKPLSGLETLTKWTPETLKPAKIFWTPTSSWSLVCLLLVRIAHLQAPLLASLALLFCARVVQEYNICCFSPPSISPSHFYICLKDNKKRGLQADSTLSRLNVLKERIDATEALITIHLDSRRNDLVAFDLVRPSLSVEYAKAVTEMSINKCCEYNKRSIIYVSAS